MKLPQDWKMMTWLFLAAKPYERHGVLLKILWDCLFSGGEEGGALDYHKGVVGTLSGYLLM